MFEKFVEVNFAQQAQIDEVDRIAYTSIANGGKLSAIIARVKSMPVPAGFDVVTRVRQIADSAKLAGHNVRI